MSWVPVVAMIGGFCGGVIHTLVILYSVPPQHRDAFLKGAARVLTPWK